MPGGRTKDKPAPPNPLREEKVCHPPRARLSPLGALYSPGSDTEPQAPGSIWNWQPRLGQIPLQQLYALSLRPPASRTRQLPLPLPEGLSHLQTLPTEPSQRPGSLCDSCVPLGAPACGRLPSRQLLQWHPGKGDWIFLSRCPVSSRRPGGYFFGSGAGILCASSGKVEECAS